MIPYRYVSAFTAPTLVTFNDENGCEIHLECETTLQTSCGGYITIRNAVDKELNQTIETSPIAAQLCLKCRVTPGASSLHICFSMAQYGAKYNITDLQPIVRAMAGPSGF